MDFTLTRPSTRKSGSAIDGFSTIRDPPPSPSKVLYPAPLRSLACVFMGVVLLPLPGL